jgi:putative MFS transporter
MQPAPPIPRARLLAFLGVATFFEGFDVTAMAQVLPQLGSAAGFGLSESAKGWLVGAIGLGPMLAWFLVQRADRVGRRPVMALTLTGYAVCTLLSGLSPNAWVFGLCQVVARAFLVGEWAVAMVYAAEEFPAGERGRVMGLLHALAYFGGLACGALAPALSKGPLGWRTVFLVGVLPALLMAFARRSLPETQRFLDGKVERAEAGELLAIWRSAWSRRLWVASAAWALTYVCVAPTVNFWKQFVVRERGFSEPEFVQAFVAGALVALLPIFAVGRITEWLGRRRSAAVLFPFCAAAVAAAFSLHGFWPLALSFGAAMFGTAAVVPLLNAWTTELFPTHLRGSAFAWSNTLLGRVGSVLAPVLMGQAASSVGWGLPVALSALGPLLASALVLGAFPETKGQELEETSRLDRHDGRGVSHGFDAR